ncbi:U7 snRNA-associated Sm-like protein LSm11 [Salvelinus alpinus]
MHKNVLTRMLIHTGSPLRELYCCVEERIRVKVHIRTFKGLRCVCSGFIVAFDKFWNLLSDKLKLQESAALRECEKKKQIGKLNLPRVPNSNQRQQMRGPQ